MFYHHQFWERSRHVHILRCSETWRTDRESVSRCLCSQHTFDRDLINLLQSNTTITIVSFFFISFLSYVIYFYLLWPCETRRMEPPAGWLPKCHSRLISQTRNSCNFLFLSILCTFSWWNTDVTFIQKISWWTGQLIFIIVFWLCWKVSNSALV